MPATVNVNFLSVVHKGSGGVSMSFPDVCKTPAPPAPPIPIPYPNIAQSSDTADGSSTVKMDGNPIMLKKSNFRMSTGDEPGSLFGVVSNKVKGKAIPILYSFDVKADGDNVFRLTDPMQTNSGSPANTLCPAEVQAPLPPTIAVIEACKETKKKKEEQEKVGTSWGESGIYTGHRPTIQEVTTEENVIIYFRKTKLDCSVWIQLKHMPKPHSCLSGTTIIKAHLERVQNWLDKRWSKLSDAQKLIEPETAPLQATNQFYGRRAYDFIGIIGKPHGDKEIEPIRGKGKQVGNYYGGKWMTGDYDLFQVLSGSGECKIIEGISFSRVRTKINKRLRWDAIQHGPQAQWTPHEGELAPGADKFDMKSEVPAVVSGKSPPDKKVIFDPARAPMAVIDKPLTAVAGKNVVMLKDEKAVIDALACKGCGEE